MIDVQKAFVESYKVLVKNKTLVLPALAQSILPLLAILLVLVASGVFGVLFTAGTQLESFDPSESSQSEEEFILDVFTQLEQELDVEWSWKFVLTTLLPMILLIIFVASLVSVYCMAILLNMSKQALLKQKKRDWLAGSGEIFWRVIGLTLIQIGLILTPLLLIVLGIGVLAFVGSPLPLMFILGSLGVLLTVGWVICVSVALTFATSAIVMKNMDAMNAVRLSVSYAKMRLGTVICILLCFIAIIVGAEIAIGIASILVEVVVYVFENIAPIMGTFISVVWFILSLVASAIASAFSYLFYLIAFREFEKYELPKRRKT